METKHTTGKWVACGSEKNLATWVEDCFGKRVCTMRQCELDWERAQLIAQAPDLLAERDRLREINAELVAALERIVCDAAAFMEEHNTTEAACIAIARAALAKAKGE